MSYMRSLFIGLAGIMAAACSAAAQDSGRSAEASALFSSVGTATRVRETTKHVSDYLAELGRGYEKSAARAYATADTLDGIAALEPDVAGPAELLSDSFRAIGDSLTEVSKEVIDGCIEKPDVFFAVQSAYEHAAWTIQVVMPGMAESVVVLQDAAEAIGGAGWALVKISDESGTEFLAGLEEFSRLNLSAGELLLVEASGEGVSAGGNTRSASSCPSTHPFRGCTEYITTTYSGGTCSGWTRLIGGIEIGVDCIISIGTEICPDGGFFTRTCTFTACSTSKCVCACYASRWDRFWAVGGVNKTVVTRNLGCSTVTIRYYTFSCGAPSTNPPAPPARDITITDGPNC